MKAVELATGSGAFRLALDDRVTRCPLTVTTTAMNFRECVWPAAVHNSDVYIYSVTSV
jgi:hypothetical protein